MNRILVYFLLILIALSCQEKKETTFVPFENKLVGDECVGYIHFDSLQEELTTSFLMEKLPMLTLFNLGNMRRKMGLASDRLFFSANIQNETVRAFVRVSNFEKLDTYLEQTVKQYNLMRDSIENLVVFNYPLFNLSAVRVDSTLLITYGLEISNELKIFQNHTVLDSAWQDVLVKNNKSFFAKLSSAVLNDYSINDISTTLELDSSIHFSLFLNKQEDFPFQFNTTFTTLSNTQSTMFADIDLAKQTISDHQKWNTLCTEMGSKISFPSVDFLKAWQGEFHLAKGGEVVERFEEIETVMDENFNTVERIKVTRKHVEALQIMLTLDNKEKLFDAMKQKGFLRQVGDEFQFFVAPPLKQLNKENYYFFHTGTDCNALKNAKNSRLLSFRDKNGFYSIDLIKDSDSQLVIEVHIKPNIEPSIL